MRTQYGIRPAGLDDLGRILEIERASFGAEAYDRKLFAHYLRRCGQGFLVVERRSRVVGYLIVCGRRAVRAELVSVAVDPSVRHLGAASALLESALRRLLRCGVLELHLVVRVTNRAARAFYEKYGFRRVRLIRRYYEDGADGIAMSRPVAKSAPMRHVEGDAGVV